MNYKFFQNTSCEFFPCSTVDRKRHNCMFCFCPIYHHKDCGGNYIILKNGMKDCSNCLIPHNDYDYIVNKIIRGNIDD